MSNLKSEEWENKLWGDGISSLEVAAIIGDLKLKEKDIERMSRGLEKAKMLECQYCHEWFSVNEMFTVDACSEKCQELLSK